MVNDSRIDIYDYLYNLFYGVVTKNVYSMFEPQDLTGSDATEGFLVLHVGNIVDESEFSLEAYGWVRCFVQAYIPSMSRGRLNYTKYKEFEDSINNVIEQASLQTDGTYNIQSDSVLSMDGGEISNSNNLYYTFTKSFIVNINE